MPLCLLLLRGKKDFQYRCALLTYAVPVQYVRYSVLVHTSMYWHGSSTSLNAEVVPSMAAESQRAFMYRYTVPAQCWHQSAPYLHRTCTIPEKYLHNTCTIYHMGSAQDRRSQCVQPSSRIVLLIMHPPLRLPCPPRPHRDGGRNEHPPDPDNITLDGESSSRGGVKMGGKNAKSRNQAAPLPPLCTCIGTRFKNA